MLTWEYRDEWENYTIDGRSMDMRTAIRGLFPTQADIVLIHQWKTR